MLPSHILQSFLPCILLRLPFVHAIPLQTPLLNPSLLSSSNINISQTLFNELEELSRIVDISYCVGATGLGITKPFECVSRCSDPNFEHFELVTTWNTGALLSDSCGYMVLSHPPSTPRIILAFRGTYSVANTIVDLSTVPQEYIPYPGEDDEDEDVDKDESKSDAAGNAASPRFKARDINPLTAKCTNCTVHAGFMKAWHETRPCIIPQLKALLQKYRDYQVTLVGHSLGGAIAALASLDFHSRGWSPQVTTFGEPRIGNEGLMKYIDKAFSSSTGDGNNNNKKGVANDNDDDESKRREILTKYRRVTHYNDPVPLLPLTEWGYQMHAGEIYISKPELQPEVQDLRYCHGDQDPHCIAGAETVQRGPNIPITKDQDQDHMEVEMIDMHRLKEWMVQTQGLLDVPPRWRIWQLFFAHRDYFWRLGLCVPGGDPHDWYRKYPNSSGDGDDNDDGGKEAHKPGPESESEEL